MLAALSSGALLSTLLLAVLIASVCGVAGDLLDWFGLRRREPPEPPTLKETKFHSPPLPRRPKPAKPTGPTRLEKNLQKLESLASRLHKE